MKLADLVCQPFFIHLSEPDSQAESRFKTLVTFGVKSDARMKHLPVQQVVDMLRERDNITALEDVLCRYITVVSRAALPQFCKTPQFLQQVTSLSHNDAYDLLNAAQEFERCGVQVLVPQKWNNSPPASPKIKVEFRGSESSKVGVSALLRFDRSVTLRGKKLSKGEIADLLRDGKRLTKIDGQWVKVDLAKFQHLLNNWDYIESLSATQGLPFSLALRLISGWQNAWRGRELIDEGLTEFSLDKYLQDILQTSGDSIKGAIECYERNQGVRLREYQRYGVSWLAGKVRAGIGALLCDDMGLGKTIQVLAMLSILRQEKVLEKVLIVAPASLLDNWKSESRSFLLGATLQIIRGQQASIKSEMIVSSYATLRSRDDLLNEEWDLVILDEAQKIKNADSQTTSLLKKLNSRVRLVMTGTPIENHLRELWSIVDFVLPGLLGKHSEFLAQLQLHEFRELNKMLHQLLSPFILRRNKSLPEIGRELPGKIEKNHFIALTPLQRALYIDCLNEMNEDLAGKRKFEILPYLMRLKKICNHPSHYLDHKDYPVRDSGKFIRLLELSEGIARSGEKFIVFTQFKTMCEPIARILRCEGLCGEVITGSTPSERRKLMVDEFSRSEKMDFLILSLHATGVGLNITAANHVIHFDRWWNPAVENQATDRAHRLGQDKTVLVHKFTTKSTIEDRIDSIISDKMDVSDDFFSGLKTKSLLSMSVAEIKDWLTLQDDR